MKTDTEPKTQIELTLPGLAKQISKREVLLEKSKQSALSSITATITLALEQGRDLLDAQQRFGPSWHSQLSKHAVMPEPDIAAGYSKLALKLPSVQELKDYPTFRQSLLACGLMPEAEFNTATPSNARPVETLLGAILKTLQAVNAATSLLPVERWDEARRTLTKRTLEPLVRFYESL